MISTVLAEHPDLVRILFWVLVVACAAVGWWLYRTGRTRVLAVLAALDLLATVALTFSPSEGAAFAFCTVQFSVPFQGIDTLANVAMLLPAALFGALATRRPLPVLAALSGFSAAIELVQALVPALGRACDTNDWVMNTVGAVVGVLLAAAVLGLERRRQLRRRGRA